MIELVIAPVCLLIDQITKKKAVEMGSDGEKRTLFNGKVQLGLIYNKGAFLGFLGNHKRLLMVANLGSLVILLIALISVFLTKGNHILKLGLSFMTGGALGNIYDRFTRKKVVDFFAFKWKSNIYFNLADMFVFLGAILLVIGSLIMGTKK